jgi:ligand-binding SRPBCC domain-containing protein
LSAERILEREQVLAADVDRAFELFADAENLARITPRWLGFRIVTPRPIEMRVGTLIEYRLRLHGVPLRWLTRIEVWEPPHRFVDVQVRGPFASWHHTHRFEPTDEGTRIRDRVRYRQRLGPLGGAAERVLVRRDLERIFDHRHRAIGEVLSANGASGVRPVG